MPENEFAASALYGSGSSERDTRTLRYAGSVRAGFPVQKGVSEKGETMVKTGWFSAMAAGCDARAVRERAAEKSWKHESSYDCLAGRLLLHCATDTPHIEIDQEINRMGNSTQYD